MSREFVRRFTVTGDAWRADASQAEWMRQGYLCHTGACSVQVRRSASGATLAVRGPGGTMPQAFDYPIPLDDADQLLRNNCIAPPIEMVRRCTRYKASAWMIDEYGGEARGLILAAIALSSPNQAFASPPWLGDEVSQNPRFRGLAISLGRWRDDESAEARGVQWRSASAPTPPSCGRSWHAGEEASRRWRYGLEGGSGHDAGPAIKSTPPSLRAPSAWRGPDGRDIGLEAS